jgi:hypothetical protein
MTFAAFLRSLRWARGQVVVMALLVSVCGLFSACLAPPVDDPARTGPFYRPTNFRGERELPQTVRRVVLLPIAGGSIATGESTSALDAVFTTELQRKNRFEVVTLTRADCLRRFQAEEFSSVGLLPANLMARLRREFDADAVLLIDLTVFKPYRPLAIGVRAKLATIGETTQLLWSFDNVYSAADGPVANSARAHFLESDRGGIPADLTPSVLQSPTRFGSYVAADMFATLPPVYVSKPTVE